MRRKVILHGSLGDATYETTGDTIFEVMEGISRQVPELQPDINGRKLIQITGCDTEADLFRPLGDMDEIHVFPYLGGEKGKLTQILVGAALIALSFTGIGAVALAGVNLGGFMFQMGAMMILGGVAQMLAPAPENLEDNGQKTKYLGAPRNTVRIGTRVPILYGEFRWGGHFLSFDINTSKSAITS